VEHGGAANRACRYFFGYSGMSIQKKRVEKTVHKQVDSHHWRFSQHIETNSYNSFTHYIVPECRYQVKYKIEKFDHIQKNIAQSFE